jgi:hypothetical protein
LIATMKRGGGRPTRRPQTFRVKSGIDRWCFGALVV